jgi:hypothetical protein
VSPYDEIVSSLEAINVSMAFFVRRGVAAARDPARWSRFRWLASVWILGLGSTVIGAGFLVAGDHILVASGPWAAYAAIPGGLRLHGVLMLTGGLPLLLGLGVPLAGYPEPRTAMRRALAFSAFYWLWTAAMVAFAGLVPKGAFSLVGFILVLMVAGWFALMALSSPPELVSKAETALYRAVLDSGCTPEQAQRVVDFYLGGSRELD